MTATYLTTDIVVIIVLIVVIVLVGLGAFFIHFYWTKIGVAEIWNTTKWSSMRSSFYRTIGRFSQRSNNKSVSEQPLSRGSIYSDDIDNVISNKQISNPKITSYITPANSTVQNPVSSISYNNAVRDNYGTKVGQSMDNTRIYNIHEPDNNRYNDLGSVIHKQRF